MLSSSANDKQPEWNPTRSVRRFPEKQHAIVNSNNNNSTISNNNLKPEATSSPKKSQQDCEPNQNIHNFLSPSSMKPSDLRPSDCSLQSDSRRSVTSDSSTNTLCEDMSFSNVINSVSNSMTKGSPIKAAKMHLPNINLKLGSPKSASLDGTDSSHDEEQFVSGVVTKGQYLIKDQWNTFIGPEDLKKYSRKIIERNDNIWEMVSLHYGCLNRLVILRDVYGKSYPYLEAGSNQINRNSSTPRSESVNLDRHGSLGEKYNNLFESIESIVPGLEPLIKCFAKISSNLINNHLIRPDRVITDIGRVLNESINDEICSELAKLYGHFNFQRHNSSQKINQFKKYPIFLSYIHKCERDPRSEKKTLSDYIQDISMFWARMTVPLNLIIEKTMNDSQEVNYLNKYKEKIQKLIVEAENIQGKFVNAQVLKTIVENYEVIPDCKESERVFEFMTADNTRLVYKGEVQFEVRKANTGRVFCRDLTGVALENCVFFLASNSEPGKSTCKYQLFQDRESFPALLEWGKLYGYFREEDSKNTNSFSFYVIIEKPEPSIKRLFVSTTTERNCWKNCMMQGFSLWQNENSNIREAEDKLNDELKSINTKWNNTQHGIELIKNLDNSLKVQLEYRTVGFRCILEEELKRMNVSGRNSSTSSTTVVDNESKRDAADGSSLETYIPDLTCPDGINDWLDVFVEWDYQIFMLLVNRLKFSLCSNGANITRSASEIEARKRPSIQTVKKCDTFTSHDSPTYEKRPTDVTFLNPPMTKQKKDQRRISVSGFTNLFRINSKTIKHCDSEKGSDPPITHDSLNDRDLTDSSTFESDVEYDSLMSNLSKDTVAAFNEINNAAKNITVELIELRTQKVTYESEIRRLKEENQSFREFYKKIQKCSADSQLSLGPSGSNHPKMESIHSPFVLNSSMMGGGSVDIMTESMESSTDNSTNFVTQSNQMAECRRQTEYLRQMYDQFANEKKKWEKDYENQKLKIEKEKDSIIEKKADLQREKDNLVERENKYRVKCLELQGKLDLYLQKYGFHFEEKTDEMTSPDNKAMLHKDQIKQLALSNPHSRSHSDDVSHKRSSQSPISPPLASSEVASNLIDTTRLNQTEVHQLPDQLRGSLINQERQSLKKNGSDDILDSRSKHSNNNFSSHKAPKMTPSIDRKEIYSNNNICFSADDTKDKDWCSDMDDATFEQKKTMSNKNVSKPEEKPYTRNLTNPNISGNATNTTPVYNNQQPSLGIPRELAAKSKVKKDKSRKMFILNR